MGVIATYLPNGKQLQRLRAAIRDRYELVECEDWASVVRTCERGPVRVGVIDVFADELNPAGRIRELKQRLPRLTLVAYVAFSPERTHDLFQAGRHGIDALVLANQDDSPRALLAVIERAESQSLGALLTRSLEGADATARDALLLAVTRVHERLSPTALARLLALPRRTLAQRLVRAGFPPPQRLLTWGRLIVAAHLLEDRNRSADRVARAVAFPSGSAFRNTCQRYLHSTPLEIRSRGGAAHVIRALLRQVRGTPSTSRGPSGTSTSSRGRRALALAV